MKQSQEKLEITCKDELRRRHQGNYVPVSNGEKLLLPYEAFLRSNPHSFFSSLSDYDFLKPQNDSKELTLKGLKEELRVLDGETDFWKNFNDSALKQHLNKILKATANSDYSGWNKTYLRKKNQSSREKPYHDDMLRCLYLLAHLHKASPTFIRQLALLGDPWSTDLRLIYPRNDFVFSEEYGAYLAELFSNILFHQPEGVRVVIKNLDILIDKMVKYSDGWFSHILDNRSEDTDSPSIKILKFCQIASITHFQALQNLLADKIDGDIDESSYSKLCVRSNQSVATANHYRLVAAQCIRIRMQGPLSKMEDSWFKDGLLFFSDQDLEEWIHLYANALSSDALSGLAFESHGSRAGKRDTSLPAAIRKMAEQNPQSIDDILTAPNLNYANIPELFSKYVEYRTQFADAFAEGTHDEYIRKLNNNPEIERAIDYVMGNNVASIYKDIESIEMNIKLQNLFEGTPENNENSTLVFEYAANPLPNRN